MTSINFRKNFEKSGKLDLLENYRGEVRKNEPLVRQLINFIILCKGWFIAVVGVACAVLVGLITIPLLFEKYLGFEFTKLINALAPLVVILAFIPVNALFLVLFERRFLALLTTRLGPNRVGPNGFLQTIADALKLLFKEDTTPATSDKILFTLAPALFFFPSVMVFLPILSVVGGGVGVFEKINFASSLLFVFGISSMSVISLLMAGWASNNKYSILGGLRSAAQAISYEIPLILSLVALVILTGSLNLKTISLAQEGGFFDWNIFGAGVLSKVNWSSITSIISALMSFVLMPVLAFIIFFCSLAESNRTPFDLPEAESELVSGFNTEYSGIKFALFFLAEYTNLFLAGVLMSLIFFGGPFIGIPALDQALKGLLESTPLGNVSWLPYFILVLFKAYLFVALAVWLRATLPRFRSDQLMQLAWKTLIPVCLVVILLSALVKVLA
jgi:NADH-quinone oxidoreductase subunit H